MRFVSNNGITDPKRNLAIEEHLLRNVKSSGLLLFYINEPSVIIGRNQNTIAEIDPDYINNNGINVVRRLSGGGGVYHDLGNLNFSFITNDTHHLNDFHKFLEPVVNVLNSLGVPAAIQGKSDIIVDGKKISGNAQFSSKGRMFSHGTILFDTSIEHMLKALNPRKSVIESHAVQSVRKFVTNVKDHLPSPMTIDELKDEILRGVFGEFDPPIYDLMDEDWAQIEAIQEERYGRWSWNFGYSPKFNMQRKLDLPRGGAIEAHLDVKDGLIQDVLFQGNFQSTTDPDEIVGALIGIRHHADDIRQALEEIDVSSYFGEIEREEIMSLLY
ncbi:MAG: lipoate--protein ligase [Chloroflexota bacterium]